MSSLSIDAALGECLSHLRERLVARLHRGNLLPDDLSLALRCENCCRSDRDRRSVRIELMCLGLAGRPVEHDIGGRHREEFDQRPGVLPGPQTQVQSRRERDGLIAGLALQGDDATVGQTPRWT